MIVIGIVAILLAVVATALAFAGSGAAVTLSVASVDVTSSPSTIFVVGGATAVVLVVGILLLLLGVRRAHGRRRQMRDLKRKARIVDSGATSALGTTSPGAGVGTDASGETDEGTTRTVPRARD